MPEEKRTVITGMAVNTPLGDTLDGFMQNLFQGNSAITAWKGLDASKIACKIGGDLSAYDVQGKTSLLQEQIPADVARRLPKLVRTSPWSVQLSILLAVAAFLDGDLFNRAISPERLAVIIGSHNIGERYVQRNLGRFAEDPDYIDAALAMKGADSDHAGTVAEIINAQGPIYTIGGACASGNIALRSALNEIRYHGMNLALVLSPPHDVSPATLHSLAQIGAVSCLSFNDTPARASRPFDAAREGFVFCQGGGALVVEELGHALARGARIYAEVLGVAVNSSASRTPAPSEEHEARVMECLLRNTGVQPQEIDFISPHATSTQLGDLAEIRAIKSVFGDHAKKLKINAPKSILGHCYASAAVVETVAAVLQMQAGRLHPSINIDQMDPEIDLDVCANLAVEHQVRCLMKNAFGFGGINSASLIRRFEDK
ncbi:MAG: beta-ketoacyl-[acyl-carrier-protein] synthase family protein [Desulfobaccales bacterium]